MALLSPDNPLIFLVHQVTTIIFYIILASVILSWLVAFNVINVRHPVVGRIYEFITAVTERLYRPIRKVMPTVFGGLDISPVIVLVLLQLINQTMIWLSSP